jgi:hypothetical protein
MKIHSGTLMGFLAVTLVLLGCNGVCDGHANADTWCDGNRVMQCQDGSSIWQYSCGSDECLDVPGKGPLCLLPGATCPTANLGYQCMGQRRIDCLASGRVVDYGMCPPASEAGLEPFYGSYCVENPGGPSLNCGWEPGRCDVDGEVRCFDDGSAICREHIWLYFRSNAETGQVVCDVTQMNGCWNGKTWCEGDVLKRCDRCLDRSRCLKVSTQALCNPGACVNYDPPAWMVDAFEAKQEGGNSPPTGCAVDLPECSSGTGMACADGTPAFCSGAGKAVIALSCADIQSVMGTYVPSDGSPVTISYGPYCVPRPSSGDVICAQDTTPCETGQDRCDPTDPSGTTIQYCEGGLWMKRGSCEVPSRTPPTTTCFSTTLSASCQ